MKKISSFIQGIWTHSTVAVALMGIVIFTIEPRVAASTNAVFLNVNFGAHLSPGLGASKTGLAATGQTANDFWNFYSRDNSNGTWRDNGALPDLKLADGTPTSAGLLVSNLAGCWVNGSSDPMQNTYLYPLGAGSATVTVTNLPAGEYDLYVYSHDGSYEVTVGGISSAVRSTLDYPVSNPTVWQEGRQYARFQKVMVAAGQAVTLTVRPGQYGYAVLSGLQLVSAAPPPPPPFLVDVDFGAGLGGNGKMGLAATGQTTNDFWNFYTRDDGAGGWRTFGGLSNLKRVDGTPTAAGLTVANAPGAWGNGSSDPMYDGYLYPFSGNATITVTNLVAGEYDVYLYANDGKYQLAADGVDYGVKTCQDVALASPPAWQEGVQYVRFGNVAVDAGQPVVITVRPGAYGYAIISGMQLVRTGDVPRAVPAFLVDVDFGEGLLGSAKVGLAAVGHSASDFWNFYTRDDGAGGWRTFGAVSNLKRVDGTTTGAGLTVANAPGSWGNGSSDPMYVGYLYPFSGNATLTLTNLAAGQYDVYLYANDGKYQLAVGGVDYGVKTCQDVALASPPAWQEGVQYARFGNVAVNAGQPVVITVRPGAYGYAIISGIQIARTGVLAGVPPTFLTEPASQTVSAGASVVFTASASGDAPLSYQWRRNGTNIAGANGTSLVLNSVQPNDAGNYSVQVTNNFGVATSTNAALVIVQFASNTLVNVDFGEGLLGSAKVGLAAVGQTASEFWNFYTRDDGAGGWRTFGVVSNLKRADGTTTAAGLTVANAPGSWGNGSSDPMYVGYIYPLSGVNATVTLTNLAAGQYDVYLYANDGNYQLAVGGVDYGIKTCQDVALASPPVWQEGVQYVRYRNVAVSGGQAVVITVRPGVYGYAIISGMQISGSTALASNTSPVLARQPVSQTVFEGANLNFSVTATGTAPLSYQWRLNGTNLPGATDHVLILNQVDVARAGYYSVRVTNTVGSVFSSDVALTVVRFASNALFNVNFGGHLTPAGLSSNKVGLAAVGQRTNDLWNFYSRDIAPGQWRPNGALMNLQQADGSATGAGLVVSNAPGAWFNDSTDVMYHGYLYPFSGNATVTVTNLPAGQYELYVYSQDGNYQVTAGGVSSAIQTTRDYPISNPTVWQEGRQYARFQDLAVAAGQAVTLTVRPGVDGYAIISGLQLVYVAAPAPSPTPFLVDVDFGGGLGGNGKVGLAATGQTTNDFWNFYTRDDGAGGWRTFGAVSNLKRVDGTPTGAGLTVANAPGAWGNGSSDPMYDGYLYPFSGNATITVTNLPVGQYDLYVYANDGNYQVTSGAADYGIKTALDAALLNPPVWQEGVQYARFRNVTVANVAVPVVLTVRPGRYGYAIISGMQIAASTAVTSNTTPTIVNQPVSQTVFAGANVNFSVTATGTAPLSYQWRLNGTNLAGATDSSLALNHVQPEQAGNYSVRVTNVAGAVTSTDAALTVTQSTTNHLLNVNFGAHQSPGLNANKTGPAALGQDAADFWNFYSRDDGHGNWQVNGALTGLKLADGTATTAGLVVSNAPGCWANGASDPMYNTYIYPFDGIATVTVTNLPAGQYDLYVYSHDGNYQVTVGGVVSAVKTTHDQPVSNPTAWQEGRQYARFSGVVVPAGEALTLAVQSGVAGYAVLSGLQLVYAAPLPPALAPFLVDVDFGAGLNGNGKVGVAATGQTTNDFWNFYTRDDGAGGWRTFGVLSNLKRVDGTPTAAGLTVANAPGAWGNGSSDPMYDGYIYPFSGNATITVTNLPVGHYNIYVYANDGNYQVTSGAAGYGIKMTQDAALLSPPIWQEGVQYARFQSVTVTNRAEPVVLTVRPGVAGFAIISGLQIVQSAGERGTAILGRLSLSCEQGDCVRVRFAAIPSQRYRVQASTDLKNWLDLGYALADDSGTCEFPDRDSDKFPSRYYRIVFR